MTISNEEYREIVRETYQNVYHEMLASPSTGKLKLPDYAVTDIKAGELTVQRLFEHKILEGKPNDYNLSEFTAEQIGNLELVASATNDVELGVNAGPNQTAFPAEAVPAIGAEKGFIPDYVRDDVRAGQITIKFLFDKSLLPGTPTDYDLTDYSEKELGDLSVGDMAHIQKQAMRV